MFTNCDKNSDDINRADIIWGPTESISQGKLKRKKTKRTQPNDKTDTTSIGIKTT